MNVITKEEIKRLSDTRFQSFKVKVENRKDAVVAKTKKVGGQIVAVPYMVVGGVGYYWKLRKEMKNF